jgi:hypothetical protein
MASKKLRAKLQNMNAKQSDHFNAFLERWEASVIEMIETELCICAFNQMSHYETEIYVNNALEMDCREDGLDNITQNIHDYFIEKGGLSGYVEHDKHPEDEDAYIIQIVLNFSDGDGDLISCKE